MALRLNEELTAKGRCVIKALLTLITIFTSLAGEGGVPHPHYPCGRV